MLFFLYLYFYFFIVIKRIQHITLFRSFSLVNSLTFLKFFINEKGNLVDRPFFITKKLRQIKKTHLIQNEFFLFV